MGIRAISRHRKHAVVVLIVVLEVHLIRSEFAIKGNNKSPV
jgi:hypothetical protein